MKTRCKCGEPTTYGQNGICDLCCAKLRSEYTQKRIDEAVSAARAEAFEEAEDMLCDESNRHMAIGNVHLAEPLMKVREAIRARALKEGR